MNIVITGASKGIGRAIAEAFAKEGFNLALCARGEADLQAFSQELQKRYPNIEVIIRPTDMSAKEEAQAFGAFVHSQWEKVDVLVNNAGVFLPGRVTDGPDDNSFETMMNTNLYSCYWMTRALLPAMLPHKAGHIFNIASIASIMPYGSYSVSKFAMRGLSQTMREELKPAGIRVTTAMPGATLTASWDGVQLPPERLMKPEDVAEALLACWKLSDRTVVEELILRPQLGDL